MSRPRKVHIPCPKCNTTLDVTVWDSVNTDLMPNFPQKIISGEFFDHICPECGFVCHIEYPTLYHDVKRGAMIWIVHKDENYDERVQEIRNVNIKLWDFTRIVHVMGELSEKVSLLESGYDDRIIEINKYLQIMHYNQTQPELDIASIFFTYEQEQPQFILQCANGRQAVLPLMASYYENLVQIFEPVVSSIELPPYAIIDQIWAKKVFTEYFYDMEQEAEDNDLSVIQLIALRAWERDSERLRQKQQAETLSDNMVSSAADECESSVRFCRKCGEKLLGDGLFCHRCGTKIVTDPVVPPSSGFQNTQNKIQPETAANTPRKRKQIPKWLTPLLLVIFVIGAVIFSRKDYLKATFLYDISITEKQEISMVVGDTHTIKYNADIGDVSVSEITWESSDTSIAKVSGKGIITAKGEGTATITASINGISKDSCTVIVSLKPVKVKNGQMIVTPKHSGYPEVIINAPTNENCFVYFENVSNSADDFAFYVSAGSSATVNAPAGTYNFFYASGDTWYGKDLKFGKDTSFYKSPDKIVLTEDSTGYDILELTLYAVVNGNMDTDLIDENEFPI